MTDAEPRRRVGRSRTSREQTGRRRSARRPRGWTGEGQSRARWKRMEDGGLRMPRPSGLKPSHKSSWRLAQSGRGRKPSRLHRHGCVCLYPGGLSIYLYRRLLAFASGDGLLHLAGVGRARSADAHAGGAAARDIVLSPASRFESITGVCSACSACSVCSVCTRIVGRREPQG